MILFNKIEIKFIEKPLSEEPLPKVNKCYICGETGHEKLKKIQHYKFMNTYNPTYYYHTTCIKKALESKDSYYTNSKFDRATRIINMIKIWQDSKKISLGMLSVIDLDDL